MGDAQIERLVQALATRFDQGVAPDHAHVGAAMLHVSRHIAGAHHDDAQLRMMRRQDQLARGFGVFQRLNTGCAKQRLQLVEDAPLGQCQGDHRDCPAGANVFI